VQKLRGDHARGEQNGGRVGYPTHWREVSSREAREISYKMKGLDGAIL
jgi:hypothetical protein